MHGIRRRFSFRCTSNPNTSVISTPDNPSGSSQLKWYTRLARIISKVTVAEFIPGHILSPDTTAAKLYADGFKPSA
jgi:hypothetical protein